MTAKDIDEAFAGDIVALAGLKETTTGDTLCAERQPIMLERMEFPEPVIELSVEPKTKADQEKMGVALNRLSAEDPSFRVRPIMNRARRSSRGWANFTSTSSSIACVASSRSKPTSVRRRWPTANTSQAGGRRLHPQEAVGRHRPVRSREGQGHSGRARFGHHLQGRDQGRQHSEGIYPRDREGHARKAETGSLVGFPIIDFEILLYDGAYHDVDSSALAFEIAGRGAMREVAQKAGIKLLEPIMKVEVVTPEEYLGDVIGDSTAVAARSRAPTAAAMPRSSRPWCRWRTCSAT
jgi:elongation factor G